MHLQRAVATKQMNAGWRHTLKAAHAAWQRQSPRVRRSALLCSAVGGGAVLIPPFTAGSLASLHSSTARWQETHAAAASNPAANNATASAAAARASGEVESAMFASLHPVLSSPARCIPIRASDVRVLSTPSEFNSTLLNLFSRAESRVLLSSLYLGTGPHEHALVDALRRRMGTTPELRVQVMLDYLRGTRRVGERNESSVTTLASLLQHADESVPPSSPSSSPSSRFALHLLHLPPPTPPTISALRLWIEQRYFTGNKTREARGVHHMKFYVVDDCVIVSGANLSDTYFTNRQDRYILIRSAALAQFYEELLTGMQQLPFAQQVRSDGSVHAAQHAPLDSRGALANLLQLVQPTKTPVPQDADTYVFPTLQMGSVGITHDEQLTSTLFQLLHARDSLPPSASLSLATGYMNLTPSYTRQLLASDRPVRFLAAARDANGWWGAKGGGKYVPELYAAAAYELVRAVSRSRVSHLLHLYEWSRSDWSYHAKGMWLSASPSASSSPLLSVIGSPNYGARSVQRDSETSLVLLTRPDSTLSRQLGDEQHRLMQHAHLVTLDGSNTDPENKGRVEKIVPPPLWLRLASRLARPYM